MQDRINNNQDINWRETKSIMCDTTTEVTRLSKKKLGTNDWKEPHNTAIIKNTKKYRIKIENSSNIEEVKNFCNIINQTLKCIENEVRKNNEREIEDIGKIIQIDSQSTAMFKAVKQIKNLTVENNIIVHNDKGETIKLINIMQWKTTLKVNFGKKKRKG